MPELPEVETIVQDLLNANLVGEEIKTASVYWPRTLANQSPSTFKKKMVGQTVLSISRRAKYIVITLSNEYTLLIHLRMSGRLYFQSTEHPRYKHEHVILSMGSHRDLRFMDTRKFGRWCLLKDPNDVFQKLGPEPLSEEFDLPLFKNKLKKTRRLIKPLLLDQSFISGLGNIYVDEALWESKVNPQKKSCNLSHIQIQQLHRAIQTVLKRGIKNLGTSLGKSDTNFYSVAGRRGRNQDGLNVFRRTGEPCSRCHTKIQRIVVAQRGTHICPKCQKL